MLLNELDHFRREIADMVEIERGLMQQTLEQESERVQHEVKDLLASSKGEIVNVLKGDVQKWLQGTHEGVFHMTETLKQDLNHLKSELSRLQVLSSTVHVLILNRALKTRTATVLKLVCESMCKITFECTGTS